MKEKLWPAFARMNHAKKSSTQNLIENISKEISKKFVTEVIIQNTNETSTDAAAALWHSIELSEHVKNVKNESSRHSIIQ